MSVIGKFVLLGLCIGWCSSGTKGGVAQAGPLRLLLQSDMRDFGFAGDDPRQSLSSEPSLQLQAPSLMAQDDGDATLELRAGHDFVYRRRRGSGVTKVSNDNLTLTTLKPDSSVRGRRIALGAQADFSNFGIIDSNNDINFDQALGDFTLSAGTRWGERTGAGVSLSRRSLDGPLSIPILNLGTELRGVEQVGIDFQETRAMLELSHRFGSATQVTASYARLSAGLNLRFANAVNAGRVPLGLDGRDFKVNVRHQYRPGREVDFDLSSSSYSGLKTASFNRALIGPTASDFHQNQVGLFWRHHQPRRASAIGLEYNEGGGSVTALLQAGPFKPGDFIYATSRASVDLNLDYSSTMLKLGYLRDKSRHFGYRAGLQIGVANAQGRVLEKADVLFGFTSQNAEYSFDQETRGLLIPSLALTYKPGRNHITLQIGQVIPLPKHKSATIKPPPTLARGRTFGGSSFTLSLQRNF